MNNNAEFFEALQLLVKEKGIDGEYLLEKIRAAIVLAVKKDFGGKENIRVVMDPATGEFAVSLFKTVVEEVEDPDEQLLPEQAVKYKKTAKVGDTIEIKLETKQFGRIAAQTAKHVIRQGIREAERGQKLMEFQKHNQELVTVLVSRVDPQTGAATVEIGKSEAVLPRSEQVGNETLREGTHIKVYVADVKDTEKGPRIVISRTHPGLVKRLFEMEVPEIFDGTVEIKAVSREAGSRTKLAVLAHDENVDAVGACIGNKGVRVARIVEELGGEKIDIVEYSEEPEKFIAAALAPAKVVGVEVDPDGAKACRATVPDAQLSLAIGNKGQNARLAAKLTGWKIDIRPESGFYGEDEEENA
jgi:N utilization substance protein A